MSEGVWRAPYDLMLKGYVGTPTDLKGKTGILKSKMSEGYFVLRQTRYELFYYYAIWKS